MIDPELKAYLDERFDAIDQRFETLERRLGGIESRLEVIDGQFDDQGTMMMNQFEYLIREIHRIEDGRPRPSSERPSLPQQVAPSAPFPPARRP